MALPRVYNIDVLRPLSWLYSLGIWVRNKMFDLGYLHSASFESQVPVICVGNLAVGGTGKTPHTEYLIRLLQRHGIGPIAVLSRGYKRRSTGFVLATPEANALRLGDEPYQFYRKFPELIVAVDEKRPHGIRKLLSLPVKPRVILLDDAMQHRYVKAGLTICLTNYNRILFKDTLLPAGRLREPAKNLHRADIVVITKCPSALHGEDTTEIEGRMPTHAGQPILYSAYRYGELVNMQTGEATSIDASTQVLVMAGIADPTVLQNYVQSHYRLLDVMTFRDHHHFSRRDIQRIRKRLDGVNTNGFCTNNSGKETIIITTEKDAARLDGHPDFDRELRRRTFFLPTEVYFHGNGANTFEQLVLDYVNRPRQEE